MQASLILTNGKAITMDAAGAVAQALAISDDRIVAVGKTSDVESLRSKDTRTIDVKCRVVYEGTG